MQCVRARALAVLPIFDYYDKLTLEGAQKQGLRGGNRTHIHHVSRAYSTEEHHDPKHLRYWNLEVKEPFPPMADFSEPFLDPGEAAAPAPAAEKWRYGC